MLILWHRYYKVLVFIGFLIVFSFGGWNYYYSVFRYHFSEEEKKQYVDSYFRETAFKEVRFHEVVENLTARARAHAETLTLKRNIFEDQGAQSKN